MYRCVVAHVKYLGVFLMVMRDFILAVNEYFSSVFTNSLLFSLCSSQYKGPGCIHQKESGIRLWL